MLRLAFLIRFFRVAPPVDPLMGVAFGAALVIAGVVLVVDPGRAAAALIPILPLQALAASSGFAGPARRGHYDLPLTTGRSRLQMAFVHWVMSAWPGIATWLMVAAIETAVTQEFAAASLSSGTVAAMLLISTVPWAVTVPWSRLAGGVGWILLLVIATTLLPAAQREALVAGTGPLNGVVVGTVAVLICPWMLVGRDLAAIHAIPVVAALVVASAAMVGVLAWIDRADVPLETAQ